VSDSTRLVLHCGAREITRQELEAIAPPPPTRSWVPIGHSAVLDMVAGAMRERGYEIVRTRIGVARNNHRLFATLDTTAQLNGGTVKLAVAVVNSTDKSLPMKFIAGLRVFCCDNLALRSDLMEPVRRKHSKFGLDRFREALQLAVGGLDQFRAVERQRVARFQSTPVTDVEAESVLLRCFDRGVISYRLLPRAIAEWRKPSFPAFEPRTLWSLENALTATLGPAQRSNPQRFVALSLSLQALLTEVSGFKANGNGNDSAA
jgi:hypothetical protein